MKVVTVAPRRLGKPNLGALLEQTERRLRGSSTTFQRSKVRRRWRHVKYPGWITWEVASAGILSVQVLSKQPDSEWQLLQAFVGYLNRHLASQIDSISIHYYDD